MLFNGAVIFSKHFTHNRQRRLIHHLAVPKWWIEAGEIHPIQWHEWSYYPMLLQLVYTMLLCLARVPYPIIISYTLVLLAARPSFVKHKTDNADLSVMTAVMLLWVAHLYKIWPQLH